jgi:hypothetical protein
MAYKTQTATIITNTNNSVTQESQDRLGNLSYVVNQVNTVNDDIYNTITSNIVYTNSNVSVQQQNQQNLISGLNNAFTFTTGGTSGTTGTQISLLNLPGSATPNMNLLKHINATMGITANNLSQTNPSIFCSGTDGNNCIRFPDSNGNTYLTSLTPTGQVVLDGSVRVNSNMTFGSGASAPSFGMSGDSKNSLIMNANRVGLGITNPSYTFDIQGNSSDGILRLAVPPTSANAGAALLVDVGGNLIVNQSIQLKPATNGSSSTLTLSPAAPTGSASGITIYPSVDGKTLSVSTPTGGGLNVTGDLKVTGNLTTNGTITSGGNLAVKGSSILTVEGLSGTINGKAITTAP